MNIPDYMPHHIENNSYWKTLEWNLERLLTMYKLDYVEYCITQKLCELKQENEHPVIEICPECKEKDESYKLSSESNAHARDAVKKQQKRTRTVKTQVEK